MSTKDLKALKHHALEVGNGIDECYATNCIFHIGTGSDIHGLKDLKQHLKKFYDAFPDLHATIDDMIVEGDKIATRYTITGTHRGVFMGIPATNKKVTIWVLEINQVSGGKFVEEWTRYDTLGFMQQLGVVPTPKK